MCVGLVGIPPGDFWSMTFAECIVKIRGFFIGCEFRSADFRALYSLTYNANSKTKKSAKVLWPLEIDGNYLGGEKSHDEIVDRNRKIREAMK